MGVFVFDKVYNKYTFTTFLSMQKQPQNPAPLIHNIFTLPVSQQRKRRQLQLDDKIDDPFDQLQIFELIRNLNDPQYPLTLQQLNVVCVQHCNLLKITQKAFTEQSEQIETEQLLNIVQVKFTPTIPHCSMAQMIGLMIKVKLMKFVPKGMKVRVLVAEGTHVNQKDINKQINDKERVAAAMENDNIKRIVQRGFLGSDRFSFGQIPF